MNYTFLELTQMYSHEIAQCIGGLGLLSVALSFAYLLMQEPGQTKKEQREKFWRFLKGELT